MSVTLEQLMSDIKYKMMSQSELDRIINRELRFSDFEKLAGHLSGEKALMLIEAERAEIGA